MNDPMKPSIALLAKLGSVVVHAAEHASPFGGREFDLIALEASLRDPEVKEWYRAMKALSLVPEVRHPTLLDK